MNTTEINRIDNNNQGELPETTKLIITLDVIEFPELVLSKTKEIMRKISEYAFTEVWPTDEEWKTILPIWFVESMTTRTVDEIMQDDFQWHFESWIESMANRAWVWWSSRIEDQKLTIILETLNIPYVFEQLLYIFYAQGVDMKKISTVDDIYGFTQHG